MRFVLPLLMVAVCLPACMADKERYPAPPDCEGTLCNGTTPGGNTVGGKDGGTEGGAGGAATMPIDQTGTVHLITSQSLNIGPTTSYTGAASIRALSLVDGTSSTAPYGGVSGTTFDFKGISSGSTWFLVEDTSGGAGGIISTFSFADLPVLPSISVPVIDLGVLQNIASSLPSVAGSGVSTLGAQVVLFISKAGASYAGAKITGGSGGAQIAYDFGSGYSDSANATGPAGTVILFNAALAGKSNITITDTANMQAYNIEVQAGPNTATLAAYELP